MQKSGICLLAAWLCCLCVSGSAWGQEAATPRKLAPNVLKVIEPALDESEAVSTVQPLYDLATTPYQPQSRALSDTLSSRAAGVVFRRDIWGVEFAFKPLRMIEAEVPQPSGKMQKKPIWYLMYRVSFDGKVLGSVPRDRSQRPRDVRSSNQRRRGIQFAGNPSFSGVCVADIDHRSGIGRSDSQGIP